MTQEDMKKILEIGIALSAEKDSNLLLEEILSRVMELTRCDAGTLYLRSGDTLKFKIMRNHTLKAYSGGDGREPNLPPVELSRENVCALALLEDRTICIEDVRNCREYDFSGPIRYDILTGYYTKSMLVVPMRDREGGRIGVLQLINAMEKDGKICGFSKDVVLAVESVASEAAIAIRNMRYIEEIKGLFQSFVRVMSSAIDERTPYNGTHTRHMAEYGERFIDFLNKRNIEKGKEKMFSRAHKEELLMSIWFHDIGKLVIPLEVMNKEARLLPEQRKEIRHRMELIRLKTVIRFLEGEISRKEMEGIKRKTEDAEELIDMMNGAGYAKSGMAGELDAFRHLTYLEANGAAKPWLTEKEYKALTVEKGTLLPEERAVMESHVSITDKLLSQIHFPDELSHVREWAADHHELLDGSGYPRGLKEGDIPMEVRIITILDVFDALTAEDRPYKPGIPVEKALSILKNMAEKEGKLDQRLMELFIESRCWESDQRV